MNKLLLSIGRLLAVTEQTLVDISNQITEILSTIVGPILVVIGSIGALYMVVLGVQYAKSEGDDKRSAIKRRLVNTAIGIVAIMALTALCFFIKWDEVVPSMFDYMITDK